MHPGSEETPRCRTRPLTGSSEEDQRCKHTKRAFSGSHILHHVCQVVLKRIHGANTGKIKVKVHITSIYGGITHEWVEITSQETVSVCSSSKDIVTYGVGIWLSECAVVHFSVCLQHRSSSDVIVTYGAGIWLSECALFRVLAEWILFRTTCHTWCRDLASQKCTFLCVSTMDILHNYLSHIVQGYGFQKVHFFVCLHHGYSSELLVTHGAGIWLPESVPLFSLCLHHGSSF